MGHTKFMDGGTRPRNRLGIPFSETMNKRTPARFNLCSLESRARQQRPLSTFSTPAPLTSARADAAHVLGIGQMLAAMAGRFSNYVLVISAWFLDTNPHTLKHAYGGFTYTP
jgi:hypothetical protein